MDERHWMTHPRVRKLLLLAETMRAAGMQEAAVDAVLRAGLKRVATQAEREIGHLVPVTPADHSRGDPQWN